MKYNLLISCLMVMILVSTVSACIKYKRRCNIKRPQDCCSGYCRDSKCIVFGDDPNDDGQNPCDTYDCSEGMRCVLRQVVCVRFPCKPIPACKKQNCSNGHTTKLT